MPPFPPMHVVPPQMYLDTEPPRIMVLSTGVWSLGNRFIAAAREALYWMPKMAADFV